MPSKLVIIEMAYEKFPRIVHVGQCFFPSGRRVGSCLVTLNREACSQPVRSSVCPKSAINKFISGRFRPSDKEGGGHPDPEIRWGPGLKKIFFSPSEFSLVQK